MYRFFKCLILIRSDLERYAIFTLVGKELALEDRCSIVLEGIPISEVPLRLRDRSIAHGARGGRIEKDTHFSDVWIDLEGIDITDIDAIYQEDDISEAWLY